MHRALVHERLDHEMTREDYDELNRRFFETVYKSMMGGWVTWPNVYWSNQLLATND